MTDRTTVELDTRLLEIRHSIETLHTLDKVNVNGRDYTAIEIELLRDDLSWLVQRIVQLLSEGTEITI